MSSDEFNEDEWQKLQDLIDEEFVKCYNNPSCLYKNVQDYKENIDEPLTDLKSILVKDDRASYSYYWENLSLEEKQKYITYTPIIAKEDEVISMRKVITTLQKDPHYAKEEVAQQHHNFLETYEWITPCVLSFGYGS